MSLGYFAIEDFLLRTKGHVVGKLVTDAKVRTYSSEYHVSAVGKGQVAVRRADGKGDLVVLQSRIPLDEQLVAFFGLYSGDGAKGSEDREDRARIRATVSFSQREPNLVKFAVDQFSRLFPGQLRFTFSLGEDAALFMDGDAAQALARCYGGKIPAPEPLEVVRPRLNDADRRYLAEKRNVPGTPREHLAFYYQHKKAMEDILTRVKQADVARAGIVLSKEDRVTASLRRPFKKGARLPGGSSRADEIHVGGLNGLGEFFLKLLYELEASIDQDSKDSPEGLVRWSAKPSEIGEVLDLPGFFSMSPYGSIGKARPTFAKSAAGLVGLWPRSRAIALKPSLRVTPLFAYAAGLYLAEGRTPKGELFAMFNTPPQDLGLGFGSSEDTSVSIMLRALESIFTPDEVLTAWKIKVGSQYFPELVAIGLKHGVPMLRGGKSGDGKLRTMEISLAIKEWALEVYPSLRPYADRYSHVEPTGAGVARADLWASSTCARWFLPIAMYTVFHHQVPDAKTGFVV